jgi:hypothetical protein
MSYFTKLFSNNIVIIIIIIINLNETKQLL